MSFGSTSFPIAQPRAARLLARPGRSGGLKLVLRLAPGAFLGMLIALQLYKQTVAVACRACEMRGFVTAMLFFQAAHNKTGWRFPPLITAKFVSYGLRLHQRHLHLRKLCLKHRIRQLRVRNLRGEFSNGRFHFRIAVLLRSLDQVGNSFYRPLKGGYGTQPVSREFKRRIYRVWAEIHDLHLDAVKSMQIMSDYWNSGNQELAP